MSVKSTCNIVSSWLVTDLIHEPKCSGCITSISSPKSSFTKVAPVTAHKSESTSFLLIPYTGASIILTFILPFFLFIAKAETTWGSTSAIIKRLLLLFITYSSIDCIFLTLGICDSTIKIKGLSSSAVPFSKLVIKWLFFNGWSYCTPSINSTIVSGCSFVSIMTTPVSSTNLNASPITLPNSLSLLEDIVATWSIFLPVTFLAFLFKYFITLLTAESIPSLIALGSPRSECSVAWSNIALANTVAVVVPSPASDTVLWAACLINVAPMFSNGSCNVIALATVTPSFVICGCPLPSSSITHLPLAPSVEPTALVSFSTPVNIWLLALSPKARFLTNFISCI